jgi:hypothetical protein
MRIVSLPTWVTRGFDPGTVSSTVSVAMSWSSDAGCATWNSEPPVNSMPKWKPPRRKGTVAEMMMTMAATMYQVRRRPTMS